MEHKYVKHANCHAIHCLVCDGGLSMCEVCNGAEGSLPTECPGEPMAINVQDRVYNGAIDFINGEWVNKEIENENTDSR